MPTIAHLTPQETQRAWDEYAEATRGLEGREYDHAEQEAWQHLQDMLAGLASPSALHDPPVG
jgi:hypothetical protein